jgi:hypothetical protein
MHSEILSEQQMNLLPLVGAFGHEFGLVGGTAVALHIGHRESIDFDLFSYEPFDTAKIKRKIKGVTDIDRVIRDETGQYTIVVQGVQMTFFHYPYPLNYPQAFDEYIRLPDLATLAAMKLFALGRRAKWKDYVDLYFILKDYHTLDKINERANTIFGSEYNEKLIREQLAYFDDINYTEQVVFRPGFETDERVIQKALEEYSLIS